MASSDFFSDLSGGLEEGLGIAGKLQNISQSRQNFEMRKHSIEQQQAQIDDSLGLQEDVGNTLADVLELTSNAKPLFQAPREV